MLFLSILLSLPFVILVLDSILRLERFNSLQAKLTDSKWSVVIIFASVTLILISAQSISEFNLLDSMYGNLIDGPQSDALGYFNGAAQFAASGSLDEYSSRRPMYPIFLGMLMRLTSSTDVVLLSRLSSLCFVIPISAFVYATYLRLGVFIASWALALTISFYVNNCGGLFMTENIGLMLALLSATAFLLASPDKLIWSTIGFGLAVAAQLARPGALFTLPLLWIGIVSFTQRSDKFKLALLLTISALAAISIDTILRRSFGVEGSYNGSNFAYNLYGLVHGGKSWSTAFTDNPWVKELRPFEQDSAIYKLALKHLITTPSDFLIGAASSAKNMILEGGLGNFLPRRLIPSFFLIPLAGAFLMIFRGKINFQLAILALSAAGVVLSTPFLTDGGYHARVIAASAPLLFVFIALGAGLILEFAFKVLGLNTRLLTLPLE